MLRLKQWILMAAVRNPAVAVYFVQGILGLARLAISFFYKDEFHLDPATVGMHTCTC